MSSEKENTRDRILSAAWKLLEKRHGRGVSMDDIAHAAGLSRQAVYLHFGSRAELLVATVRYVDEKNELPRRIRGIAAAGGGKETLEAFVDFWGGYIPKIFGLAKALLDSRASDPAAAAAWEDRMSAVRDGCRSVVECIVRDGLLAAEWTPRAAAEMMWAMFSVASWENLTRDLGWSNNDYVEKMKLALTRTFMEGSRSPGASAGA
jgi:AcrR family transcriptional regulator